MNTTNNVEGLRPGFTYLLFTRLDPAKNAYRYYYLGWQPTLFHAHAVVRIAGRTRNDRRQVMNPVPFASFNEAWPYIRAIIRRRLRNGYRIVDDGQREKPMIRITFTGEASEIVEMEQLVLADV